MVNLIFWPLIFAIASPFIWGFVSILDKFVVSHKVKNPLSFTVVAGIVNFGIGIILALFLNWNGIINTNLIFPAIAGLIFGYQYFLYYYLLKKEDVSDVIGLVYFYPIIVTLLSFLFLNEILPLISYLGLFFILSGVIILSVKKKKLKFKVTIWAIILLVIVVALYEFLIKISTINLPLLNGLSINYLFIGCAILSGLINKKIRNGLLRELKNIKWAMLNEFLTFFATAFIFLAMAELPATIVSSIAAIEPLFVLFFEFCANKIGIKISINTNFKKKIIPIFLIVIGVILLYLPEIIKNLNF